MEKDKVASLDEDMEEIEEIQLEEAHKKKLKNNVINVPLNLIMRCKP